MEGAEADEVLGFDSDEEGDFDEDKSTGPIGNDGALSFNLSYSDNLLFPPERFKKYKGKVRIHAAELFEENRCTGGHKTQAACNRDWEVNTHPEHLDAVLY